MTTPSIAVLGAGSWGTALAMLLARNGFPVRIWGHEPGHMEALAKHRENRDFLPGVPFPDDLGVEPSLSQALALSDECLVVVPSHAFGEVITACRDSGRCPKRLFWATKGFEAGSGHFLSDVAHDILGEEQALGIVSGPTFAGEVARGLPTAITVAASDPGYAGDIAGWLINERTRAYTSEDLIGVQLGGAVKNVLAIAAGVSDGLGFGANSRTALITRGLAEMMRLGLALGARQETLMGLAGMGDLVLTCTDNQSRNRRMGLALGSGRNRAEAEAEIGQVVEGCYAAAEVAILAERHQVDMPICAATAAILFDGLAPSEAVRALFARLPKAEGI